MQAEKAAALRQSWGDKPCDHPGFDKEYYLGAQSGDYVCVQCGKNFFEEEVNKILAQRRTDQ